MPENTQKRSFDIWMEGFRATGQSGGARLFKEKVLANTFQEACDIAFGTDKYYSPDSLTYWGCELFDNEQDARKAFG